MKNIVIGRYIPGTSFLYKMDPRTKIIALFVLMVSTFILQEFHHMFIALGFVLILLLVGRISLKRIYFGLRPLMFLLLFTFTFQVLFNTQGTIVVEWNLTYTVFNILIVAAVIAVWIFTKKFIKYRLLYVLFVMATVLTIFIRLPLGFEIGTGSIQVYDQSLQTGFFIMMRLIIIVTLSTMLTLSTKPTDLNLGLESVLKPLKIVRVNTEEMAMIIAISLRYIPTLLDEANKIMLAQASRGVDFSEGKMKDKVMQIISLLVPMFIISFKRSDELANAMEARSFVPGEQRTRLHHLAWKHSDTIAIIISCVALTTAIVVRIVL